MCASISFVPRGTNDIELRRVNIQGMLSCRQTGFETEPDRPFVLNGGRAENGTRSTKGFVLLERGIS